MLISHKLKLGPSTFYFKIMPKLKENKDQDQKGGNFGGSKNVRLQRENIFLRMQTKISKRTLCKAAGMLCKRCTECNETLSWMDLVKGYYFPQRKIDFFDLVHRSSAAW